MALSLLAANNAQTVLAAGISSTATSLTVNAGTGTLFPSPVAGTSFFKLTIIDAATGSLTEIIHVTARNGDVFTIQRGQEGTVPRAWSANDIAANMMTAGTLSYILGNFQPLDPTLTALAALVGAANKLPYFNGDDTAALTDLTQVGRDIIGKNTIAAVLQYLGLVPGIILPEGYNIPAHIVNTPGIVYSAQFPGTYTNEPAFGGEWFDVYAAKHVSDACTFIAVSRTGKIATGSYSANTFSGWNYSLNSSNTTQAGRDLVAKNDATEMAKYLGLDVISGRLLNIVKMTASGTYTPTAGTKSIIVEAIGGGGASGNLTATASNQNAVSAAGSNGAYAKARYTSGFSSVSVTVGAGGIVNGGGGG
ncbi:hypothetical protein OGV51_22555, partial [Citrobacter sp. Cf042]|nr:hypothetical protein [Citrobacter sp. Cf042]